MESENFVVPCGVGGSRYPLDLSTLEKVSIVKPRCEKFVSGVGVSLSLLVFVKRRGDSDLNESFPYRN